MKASETDLQEINQSLNEGVAKSIKGTAFVLIVMYTVLIGMHLILIPGNAGIIMASTAGISVLLIAAIAYRSISRTKTISNQVHVPLLCKSSSR